MEVEARQRWGVFAASRTGDLKTVNESFQENFRVIS